MKLAPSQIARSGIAPCSPADEDKLHRFHQGPNVDVLAVNRRDIWCQCEELKHIKCKALVSSKEAQRCGSPRPPPGLWGVKAERRRGKNSRHHRCVAKAAPQQPESRARRHSGEDAFLVLSITPAASFRCWGEVCTGDVDMDLFVSS